MIRTITIAALAAFVMAGPAGADSARRGEAALSGTGWRVWLDEKAEWQKDKLYAPGEANLEQLPVNPPTGGWGVLENSGQPCQVPASVEEYFSGGVNTWNYHGVSWFWKTFDVPTAWRGKTVRLQVEKAHLRAEIYVNGKLAGYDLVAETPFAVDLSRFLKYGARNQLAVRLTNPGGQRGWEDFPGIKWGEYLLPASHDFSGLGNVSLVVTEPVYISDVFVKNLPPAGARNIQVFTSVHNPGSAGKKMRLAITIKAKADGRSLTRAEQEFTAAAGKTVLASALTVAGAGEWSVENPALYVCETAIAAADGSDATATEFGFRVFEVRSGTSGEHNFYLNGKRFFHKSAIDWGYYALTGFYATERMAHNSVDSAKAIGHNGINFHRRLGEPLVFKYADEMGLTTYEEPGGFHAGGQGYCINDNTLAATLMTEKVRRMVIRDRNHPSLIVYNLCNEDNGWNTLRERVLKMVADLDGTRLVINTSGAEVRPLADKNRPYLTWHFRPYETVMRSDFVDRHNAGNGGERFNDRDFHTPTHREQLLGVAYYPGEVMSTTGPVNWYRTVEDLKEFGKSRPGYDANIYTMNHAKTADGFAKWRMNQFGSRVIQSPADVSLQAGRGMMYIDGRHGQSILVNNFADGYAINGWSPGPQSEGNFSDWDSAMVDENRILKGPAIDYGYWTRPAQIAIFRKNGKWFEVGKTARFEFHLVNQGIIPQGEYELEIGVRDGLGKRTAFAKKSTVHVLAGDCFAQALGDLEIQLDPAWHAGYITVEATLSAGGKSVANGCEQILLKNRPSFAPDLNGLTGATLEWPAAKQALADANSAAADFQANLPPLHFVAAGAVPPDAALDNLLQRVEKDGTLLLVKFDKKWAAALLRKGVLAKPVTEWGGRQTPHWLGNGWGYLDHFIGKQAVPGGSVIGTNAWEIPADPTGFYPFESARPMSVYGLYMARPWLCRIPPKNPADNMPSMLVLIGAVDYGKGKIVLDATYPIAADSPLSDMLFFNILSMGCRGQW